MLHCLRQIVDDTSMDTKKRSNTILSGKINKCSFAVSIISLCLAAMLSVRIEVVHRKAESTETKLENHIQRVEDEMQAKMQSMVKAMLNSNVIPTSTKRTERNDAIFGEF